MKPFKPFCGRRTLEALIIKLNKFETRGIREMRTIFHKNAPRCRRCSPPSSFRRRNKGAKFPAARRQVSKRIAQANLVNAEFQILLYAAIRAHFVFLLYLLPLRKK